jgi:hypothetical protein
MNDRGCQLFQGMFSLQKGIVQAHPASFVLRMHPLKTGEEGMQSHQPGLKTLLSLFRLAHNQSLLGELENGDQSA